MFNQNVFITVSVNQLAKGKLALAWGAKTSTIRMRSALSSGGNIYARERSVQLTGDAFHL